MYICIYVYSYVNLSNDVLHLVFAPGSYQFLWGLFSCVWRPHQQKPAEGNIKNLYPKDAEFAGAAPGWQLGNLVFWKSWVVFGRQTQRFD